MDSSLRHVAMIPDGNRRWAQHQGVSALQGHKAGAEAMFNVTKYLLSKGLPYLTVWGFSTDNWKRSPEEVDNLFQLLAAWIERDTLWLHSQGVRLRHLGRLKELPDFLQMTITKSVELTSDNTGMTLNLAFNYSGRAEIVDAVNQLLDESGYKHIDEKSFSRYLYTDGIPNVDLLIRTGSELRSSDFMLWQTCYAEYYFTDVLWPDFSTGELEKALQAYSKRERRFGE